MNNHEVQFCQNDQETLDKIIQLRYKILRSPWGKPIESVFDLDESPFYNAYIQNEAGKVLACGRLQIENNIAQIRFMAVDQKLQGKGLGQKIIKALEDKAQELKAQKIVLQARENALGFYDNLNYRLVKPSHKLWSIIQHYEMEKTLS